MLPKSITACLVLAVSSAIYNRGRYVYLARSLGFKMHSQLLFFLDTAEYLILLMVFTTI